MSISEITHSGSRETSSHPSQRVEEPWEACHPVLESLQRVREVISPVWPLRDYVAVNPYMGLSSRSFLNARQFLRAFSECETLMPLEYYRERYQQGALLSSDIAAALDEVYEQYDEEIPRLTVADILSRLSTAAEAQPGRRFSRARSPQQITSISEAIDEYTKSEWTATIRDEISKFCAAHYDEGQASWSSPWKQLPLYQAWRSAAQIDRRIEILGIAGFRAFVAKLPHTPEAALAVLLERLGIPPKLWEMFLLCQAFLIPGWSAWAKYQELQAERDGQESNDFAGLLAMRLAYELAVSESQAFRVDWSGLAGSDARAFTAPLSQSQDDALPRYVLLRASEIAYQRGLVDSLRRGLADQNGAQNSQGDLSAEETAATDWKHTQSTATDMQPQTLAQMVFCIDVRSERLRRHLESVTSRIQTSGFAGFFGLPIEYVGFDDAEGNPHVPALLTPRLKVSEGLRDTDEATAQSVVSRRRFVRGLRKAWKAFQSSAVSCFSFVESAGFLYAPHLIARIFGWQRPAAHRRFDGVLPRHRPRLGPLTATASGETLPVAEETRLAESILRGLGLTERFAPLVVFCGHGSTTENNPLQAGLDCGACCGHSGEANARFAAQLLNRPEVRQQLSARGIVVPADVHFAAALHDTTNDTLTFFDTELVPHALQSALRELRTHVEQACLHTRTERLPTLSADSLADLLHRGKDWSEVRPEWGLAGNAAFVVGPRSLTRSVDLGGRTFLHNYDADLDTDHALLEQIMTAPMIVTHWINMQYYASTVDNRHFGSGNKTIHNVVGRFGVFSGNGGDLMTGLPWQSVHDGDAYQHEPLRLLVVIAASREAIEGVIEKHSMIGDLLTNGWLNLIALDGNEFYRYTATGDWVEADEPVGTLSCLDAP